MFSLQLLALGGFRLFLRRGSGSRVLIIRLIPQVQVILQFPLRPSILERISILTENRGINSRHTLSSKGKLTELASNLSRDCTFIHQ